MTPPERQQFGGHLLCRKENEVRTAEAPEGRIIFTWITSSPQEKWREEIVNILSLSAKMSITTFPKLLSFTCHLPFTNIPEYPIYYILKIDPQNYILLSP